MLCDVPASKVPASPASLETVSVPGLQESCQRLDWKNPEISGTVPWESFVRRVAACTDQETLWSIYRGPINSVTAALIQHRLMELAPADTLRRALQDTDGAREMWGMAIGHAWAVHESDEVLASAIQQWAPTLKAVKEPQVHHYLRDLTRCLGVERIIRLCQQTGFDAIPDVWHWLFSHCGKTSPELAASLMGKVPPAMMNSAREGYINGLIESRPEQALHWLGTQEFDPAKADALRLKLAEKIPGSLMLHLEKIPRLLKDQNLLKEMVKGLGSNSEAAAWGNRVLEGAVRREFLANLAQVQLRGNPIAALDTLALLPEDAVASFLSGSIFDFPSAVREHPVYRRFSRKHFTPSEKAEIQTLLKSDPGASLQQALRASHRMDEQTKSNIAITLSQESAALAWQFIQPPPGRELSDHQVRYLSDWSQEDPAAAAEWATGRELEAPSVVLDLARNLADVDEQAAEAFVGRISDEALRQQARLAVTQRIAGQAAVRDFLR